MKWVGEEGGECSGWGEGRLEWVEEWKEKLVGG